MFTRLPWKGISVCALLLVVAGAAFAWWRQPVRTSVYTDAETIRTEQQLIEPRDVLWQPPTPLAAEINTAAEDYEPQLSWDGLTLFFVRGKAGENADLYYAQRTPDGWTQPAPLTGINSEYDELGPEPTRDGSALYFYSDRPGGVGGYDIWISRRVADGWSEPENLGPNVNSTLNDYGPALTPTGDALYFSSNRPLPEDTRVPNPDAWPATVREEFLHRTYDLYMAPQNERGFGVATPVIETLTPFNEATPCVSPAGDFLYFASDRPEGMGGFDLYRARRTADGLWEPENLEPPVNTPSNELDPGLAQLGYGLYFSSDRVVLPPEAPLAQDEPTAETVTAGAQRPDYNLYYSASREVFLDVEEQALPPIDWAALLPWLLWLLLALLLLATLWALWGAIRDKRLGLLARCLIGSLMAHLLLLLLFSFMKVTEQVMSGFRQKEAIQISLASPVQTAALTDQVRPDFSDQPTLAPPTPQLTQDMPVTEQTLTSEVVETEVARVTPEAQPLESATPRDARPEVARSAPVPNPATPAASSDITLPVPDEVLAESAPETSVEAIAADLETPRLEPTPPRFATSQPVRADDYVEPDDRIAGGLQLPTPERTMNEARRQRPVNAAPQAQVLNTPTALALDLPDEVPQQNQQAAPQPQQAPQALAADLGPRQLQASAAPLQLAVSETPLGRTETFALAAATEPVVREARPDHNPNRAPMPVTLPAAQPASLPLALLEETRTEPAPEPAAPPTQQAEPVALALAEPTPLTANPAPADPTELQIAPLVATAVTLPSAAPTMREARTRDRTTPLLRIPNRTTPLPLQLDLPSETTAPQPPALAHRVTPERQELLEEMGGDKQTEAAVARALDWLDRHQSKHGGWDGLHFDRGCGGCSGKSEYAIDSAVTGLSLLCFLGAGHSHTEDGPYRDTVARGIAWLLNRQEESGNLGPTETMYSHGIATIALAEAYALTGDPALYAPLRGAVEYIAASANPRTGGWRYQPGEVADTSVTGWQVMALASARTAGLAVPQDALDSATRWLDRAQIRRGLYVYQPGEDISVTMTAEAMFMRQLLGRDRGERDMQISARFIARELPDWDEVDTYRWYYTTLALFHHQGPNWSRWNDALKRELLEAQRTTGKPSGSWDPEGPWSEVGGRVYQTALCTLMLETYYRYLPMYAEREAPSGDVDNPMGRLYGRVYDREDGAPLTNATVRLDHQDGPPITVQTDEQGRYTLEVPQMPEHFALTASARGYAPGARTARAAALADGRLQVNFSLERASESLVALEDPPVVHHLGNDRWEGQINSQFQRSAEGSRIAMRFTLQEDPTRYADATLTLLAKGVQCPHRMRINGQTLRRRMEESPEDGSYGLVQVPLNPNWMQEGENVFELRASSCAGDLDDFEFINVQIRFEE